MSPFLYLDTDLHKVIRAGILEDIHKQYIIYQLLKAMKYIHSAQILHRDLKPSNLLLNSECLMKLADFGLARSVLSVAKDESPVLTDYVATRWYRAPEILLGSTTYTKGVDIWSIGCIMGELFGGKTMFPGTSTMNQLERIIAVTGKPSQEDVDSIQSAFASSMLESIDQDIEVKSLKDLYPKAKSDQLDLMKQMLLFNPAKRITAADALCHKYLAQFHNTESEPDCKTIIKLDFDDNTKYSVKDYVEKLYMEIRKKRDKKTTSSSSSKEREESSASENGDAVVDTRKSTGGTSNSSSSSKTKSSSTSDNHHHGSSGSHHSSSTGSGTTTSSSSSISSKTKTSSSTSTATTTSSTASPISKDDKKKQEAEKIKSK